MVKAANFSEKAATFKPQSSQISQSNCSELGTFLCNNNFLEYFELFFSKAFKEMEMLRKITAEILNEMKIPPGHQIKLMKALRKDAQIAEKPEILRNVASSSVPKRTDLEELPLEIAENHDIIEKSAAKSLKKMNFSENQGKYTDFQRKFQENSRVDKGTCTSPKNSATNTNTKKNTRNTCWNCFKLFENCQFCEYTKSFCSESCKKAFLRANELFCSKCAGK